MHSYHSENFTIHHNGCFDGNMIIHDGKRNLEGVLIKKSTKEIEISYDDLKRIIKIHMNLHGIVENHVINVNGIDADWKEFAQFVSYAEIRTEISKLESMDEENCLTWLFKKLCL